MEVLLFAGTTSLGKVNSRIVDDSMGVVGGLLEPSIAYYENFQLFFRSQSQKADWKKLAQLEVRATLETGTALYCEGGICVTDVEEYDEVSVEFCGLSQNIMDVFRT